MNLKDTYNKIAGDWYKDHKSDDWWVVGTDKFISLLKPGDQVLDVGCGAGVKSKYLHDRGLNVTGIDFSEKFIDIARRDVPSAKFEVLDMKNVAELEQEFDGIFAQASLLHIPKNEAGTVIKNLASKLKPQGVIYIAVKEIYPGDSDEKILEENDYGYSYERFFSFYTMAELEEYLIGNGMKIIYKIPV